MPDPENLPYSFPVVREPAIVVYKSRRILELWDGVSLVRQFPIGLGFSPQGGKRREGDGRTPEGNYAVCVRKEKSRFHLALGVNYPNEEDAGRGLEQGLISREQYGAIISAVRLGKCPPWNTGLGGEICLHGGGADRDWTAGCIALQNEDMEFLWACCQMGTPIQIYQ